MNQIKGESSQIMTTLDELLQCVGRHERRCGEISPMRPCVAVYKGYPRVRALLCIHAKRVEPTDSGALFQAS